MGTNPNEERLAKFPLFERYRTPLSQPTDFVCRLVRIPNDPRFLTAVNELIGLLMREDIWETDGISKTEATILAGEMWLRYLEGDACMIGTVHPYATEEPPRGWLQCDGSQYDRVDYPELYAALDPVFIVDADHFEVPDLRGKFVFGSDVTRDPGDTGGSETHTLTTNEMPSHSHTSPAHNHTSPAHNHTSPSHSHTSPAHTHTNTPHTHTESAVTAAVATIGEGVPSQGALPIPSVTGAAAVVIDGTAVTINGTAVNIDNTAVTINNTAVTINNTGGGQAHNNMPPFLALKWGIIAK